jgi:hypothetical protein
MKRLLALATVPALATVLSLGCSSGTQTTCDVPIDPFKEILINDPAVIDDVRARNGSNGAWSFRHAMENMAPLGMDPGDFVVDWLRTWEQQGSFNGYPLDDPKEEPRAPVMHQLVLCPWYKRTPANECNADCSTCKAKKIDLGQAPFRLEAIVNRVDLREQFLDQPTGEGRLVYGLMDRAADDPAAQVLPFGMTIEYILPESRSAKEWAAAWHALGKHADFDEAYRAELQQITDAFTTRGARPSGVNGNSLAQLRTNESAFNWIWQLREFKLDSVTGKLKMVPVKNTPAQALNGSTQLRDFLLKNRDAVMRGQHDIPASLRPGSADALIFKWTVPGVDEPLRRAFAAETCNGCHSGENISVDSAFHISPFKRGKDALSNFIFDRTGGEDELKRRERAMRRAICGTTSETPDVPMGR